MGTLLVTVRAAVLIFVGTSIEDFFGLTALFMSARTTGRPRPWQIVTGWYTGIGFLVIVSVAAALGLVFVPQDWAGLLGLVPLTIGAVKLTGTIRAVRAAGTGTPVEPVIATRVASIAALAISNGGDNIGVYVPTFRTVGPGQSAVMVAVFAVCLAAWCFLASVLGSHKKVTAIIGPYGKWIIPAVYLTVGIVIIASSGIIGRLAAA
jgi:cadmium resistance protein CadD (predicted permease)